MTPEELELAKATLMSVSNVSAQGWAVLVQGTVTANIIYAVCFGIDILAGLVFAAVYSKDQRDKPSAFVGGFIIGACICGTVLLFVSLFLVGIFAPEYTVLNQIVNAACR